MLIFTAPGQGAQTPGFLSPWLEIPELAEQFGAWSELAGRDLIKLGTTGSAEEITDTAVGRDRGAGPVDLVVAATAELFGLTLLHHDRDFATVAGVTGAGAALVRPD